MNLDELVLKIKELTDEDSVDDLLFILKDLKKNIKTVIELEHTNCFQCRLRKL